MVQPKLKPGDTAPPFSLPDQDGNTVKSEDYRDRKLLVYFYPRADTSGCTVQSCSVRDARPDFEGLGVAVVGISPDAPGAQKKFDQKHGLGFPLLSDPETRVATEYGALGEKSLQGKITQGIVRSAFLIDEEGRVIDAWYGVSPEDTVPKAMAAL